MTNNDQASSPLEDVFLNQYNLILLAGTVAFAFALRTPVPIFAGLCAEGVWLFLGTQVPPLRAAARAHRAYVTAARTASSSVAGGPLTTAGPAARFTVTLNGGLGASTQVAADLAAFSDRLRAHGHPSYAAWDVKLQAVLATYQQLSAEHARASAAFGALQAAGKEQSVDALERSLASAQDAAARMALRRALSQAQRRVRDSQALEQELQSLDERLARIAEGIRRLPSLPVSSWDALPAWLDEINALAARAAEPRELMSARGSAPAVRVTGTYFTEPEKP